MKSKLLDRSELFKDAERHAHEGAFEVRLGSWGREAVRLLRELAATGKTMDHQIVALQSELDARDKEEGFDE